MKLFAEAGLYGSAAVYANVKAGNIKNRIPIERESSDVESPPGTITRSFKSIIRVKDQEMVLLGGIEKNIVSKTSKGLPFVARVPVLKWIFGKSSKNNSTQKLSVFVKPTII